MTDDELYETLRRCYSLDELHRIWRAHSDRIVANAKLNELYNERSMSLDGP